MYKEIHEYHYIPKKKKLVKGGTVREIVTSFKFVWFDILDENGLSFIEKTANRLTPESMFMV